MINNFIRYERIEKSFNFEDYNVHELIQKFLDGIIIRGYEIIYYDEEKKGDDENYLKITTVIGMRNETI